MARIIRTIAKDSAVSESFGEARSFEKLPPSQKLLFTGSAKKCNRSSDHKLLRCLSLTAPELICCLFG